MFSKVQLSLFHFLVSASPISALIADISSAHLELGFHLLFWLVEMHHWGVDLKSFFKFRAYYLKTSPSVVLLLYTMFWYIVVFHLFKKFKILLFDFFGEPLFIS
jgi:hypothetical protein